MVILLRLEVYTVGDLMMRWLPYRVTTVLRFHTILWQLISLGKMV